MPPPELVILASLFILFTCAKASLIIDIPSGSIEWQLPTQQSSIINEAYNFYYSKLVSDGQSIFFSNNKNEFIQLISKQVQLIG